jgi:hypothetical protein
MGIFSDKKQVPSFLSREQAFDYRFAELVDKGVDVAEAAEKANHFADIIATNKGLPATLPKPQNGIEKAVGYVNQIVVFKKENPEAWDLLTGAVGGLFSGFALLTTTGSKPAPPPQNLEKINFDELK